MLTIRDLKESKNAPVEEAYNALRTNINFCGINGEIKTLAVASFAPGDGKTTTAINLAVNMARSGKKAIVIDADLRKPVFHKQLSGVNQKGLANYISGTAELNDIIDKTSVDNLYFISCGPKPPNPTELLDSERFSGLLEELKKIFDIVIIDTPPLGSVIDCAIIASHTDTTLLVIKPGSAPYYKVQKLKEQLEKVNARILGVVLNKVAKRDYKKLHSYYNYYG